MRAVPNLNSERTVVPIARTVIFFSGVLIYLLIGSNYGLNIYDEAIALYGAESVMYGELPYNDFWTMYAPGQYYLLGAISEIFSWHIMTGRVLSILSLFLSSILLFNISKKIIPGIIAFAPTIIFIAWAGANPFYSRAIPSAILLILLSIHFLILFYDTKKYKYSLIFGCLTGLTAIFRHDAGFYLMAAGIILFLTDFALEGMKKIKYSPCKALAIYFGGILTIGMPIAVYFLWQIPFDVLYAQLIEVPAGVFREYRSLPFPVPFAPHNYAGGSLGTIRILISGWEGIVFYLPLLVYIITFIKLFKIRKQRIDRSFIIRLFVLIIGLFLYNQASVRSETEHLFPTLIFASVLLIDLLNSIKSKSFRYLIILISLLFFISVPVLKKAKDLNTAYSVHSMQFKDVARANGIIAPKEWVEDYQETIKFIQQNVPRDDKIFVGCIRHDKILVNDVMLYFLCERHAASSYHELHPGIATEEPAQKTITEDIAKSFCEYIIMVDDNPDPEPNKSAKSSGIFILDTYLNKKYQAFTSFGPYKIRKLKDDK